MDEFKAGTLAVGQRADIFVSKKYPEFSRSSLKSLFENEGVKVKNKPVKPSYRLKNGDKLIVDSATLRAEPAIVRLPVIYEDDDVIVINKPAGILTHSKGAINLEPTVASFIRNKLTDKSLTGNRAGIVHRLDRATSGVIVTARNQKALKHLQDQFSNRQAKKTYLAVVEGIPKPDEALIDVPIGRNPKRPQTFKVSAAGKPAQTQYKVKKKIKLAAKNYSLVELKPLTGRTHQIRVHLAYIGHPVVGDPVYGRGNGQLLLHSSKLELVLPSGTKKSFTAPLPKDFKDFLENE